MSTAQVDVVIVGGGQAGLALSYYLLGLDWLHTARSGLFTGVGEDAAYLAEHMAAHPIEH